MDPIAPGLPLELLEPGVLEAFHTARDKSVARLASDVAVPRSTTANQAAWDVVATRSEYDLDEDAAWTFHERL